MPGAGLIPLLDDIASVLDDVAALTKVATKKTAGVLGDDLALNAQQVAGVRAERELSVVWAVAKGSLVNKTILVPCALAISAFAPWAVTPLLMVGGGYLCFEGCEKLAHRLMHSSEEQRAQTPTSSAEPAVVDFATLEKAKIKGAVRTDFVLSAEIVTISLGSVAHAPFATQISVLVGLSLIMTVGVYGLVAGIVKLDDLGALLSRRSSTRAIGTVIVRAAPWLMKALSVAGTVAMFLVGGGILSHGLPHVHELILRAVAAATTVPGIGAALAASLPPGLDALLGIAAGSLVLALVTGVKRVMASVRHPRQPHGP